MKIEKCVNDKILRIVQENPDLEIVAVCEDEMLNEGSGQVVGELQNVTVEEFAEGEEEVYIKGRITSEEDAWRVFEEEFVAGWYIDEDMSYEEQTNIVKGCIENMNWEKVIVLWVGV